MTPVAAGSIREAFTASNALALPAWMMPRISVNSAERCMGFRLIEAGRPSWSRCTFYEISPQQTLAYDTLKAKYVHETVNHIDAYVRGQVHTNSLENFWSLTKRSLKGTYVCVEPFHLDRYLDEQMFRFNNRATKDNPQNDADRFYIALSRVATSGSPMTN